MSAIYQDRITHLRFPGMVVMDVSGRNIIATVCGFDSNGRVKLADGELLIDATPIYETLQRRKYPDVVTYVKDVLIARMAEMLAKIDHANPSYRALPVGISFSGQVNVQGELHSASSILRGARLRTPLA